MVQDLNSCFRDVFLVCARETTRHKDTITWYMIHDLEAPLPGTNICDPSLQVYIGYQLGSQVVPCNGVSNVSLHYMVVSVIPVSNVISGRMGSQSHSYLILHCVLDTGITSHRYLVHEVTYPWFLIPHFMRALLNWVPNQTMSLVTVLIQQSYRDQINCWIRYPIDLLIYES